MSDRIYRKTTQEIVNPQADRRYKREWLYQPTVPAGTIFSHLAPTEETIGNIRIPGNFGLYCYDHAPLYSLMLTFSQPVEPLPGVLFKDAQADGAGVLAFLLEHQHVTPVNVVNAIRAVEDADEGEWRRIREKWGFR